MRVSRARAFVVLVVALLHLAAGGLSALAPCCDDMVHASGERMMECCLKGGPNHICPYMSKGARKKLPTDGRMAAACGAGHDQGVPAMGFAGLPVDAAAASMPLSVRTTVEISIESVLTAVPQSPSPPPRV